MIKKRFNIPFVNAHAHAAMVAFRGKAEDLLLEVWLKKHIWPQEALHVRPKFVYKYAKEAIKEMKENGIRAFCDMYFFERDVARAAIEEKMQVIIGEGIINFPTPSALTPNIALKKTEELIKEYQNNPYVKVAVSPHAISTASEKILGRSKELAKKYNTLFQIHLTETKKEFDDCKKNLHLTPVEYLDKLGILDEHALLAHCVWLTDKDIKIIAARGAHVAHCPLSNLKLGSGIAPIAKMIKAGINVCLGTDGAASSNRLDIWEAGKFAALLQKGVNLDPTLIPAKTAVKMMSINGMRALGIEKLNGLSASQWEKEIDRQKDFAHIYHDLVTHLEFKK